VLNHALKEWPTKMESVLLAKIIIAYIAILKELTNVLIVNTDIYLTTLKNVKSDALSEHSASTISNVYLVPETAQNVLTQENAMSAEMDIPLLNKEAAQMNVKKDKEKSMENASTAQIITVTDVEESTLELASDVKQESYTKESAT